MVCLLIIDNIFNHFNVFFCVCFLLWWYFSNVGLLYCDWYEITVPLLLTYSLIFATGYESARQEDTKRTKRLNFSPVYSVNGGGSAESQ